MKCNDQLLIELLHDDEFAGEGEATQHLSTCSRCQTRITELAADPGSWSEVEVALHDSPSSSSVVITLDAAMSDDMPLQADQISLGFLDAPSHPEMLGRIGRYEVERLVGAGGMGIVLKAFDTELHRPVAVKVLAPHLAHSGGARQRFAREAQSAAAVVHENVVPIHNVDVAGKLPFLVMQFVPGESLQHRVESQGPLSVHETLRIGIQIAHGLAAAHTQGLVHRDVKPGNVLLEESVDRVLISDFGLARAADDASMTRSGVIAGTPHYMSPEQARGEYLDATSDIFSLGSVLYFMCTGHPPFRAHGAMGVLHRICSNPHRPVDDINREIPADFADYLDLLLSKEKADRPQTATQVAEKLESLLFESNRPSRIRLRNTTPLAERTKRKNSLKLVLLACGGALALSLAGVAVWYQQQQPQASGSPESAANVSRHTPLMNGEVDPADSGSEQTEIPRRSPEAKPSSSEAPHAAVDAVLFSDAAFDAEVQNLNMSLERLEQRETAPAVIPYPGANAAWQAQHEMLKGLLNAVDSGHEVIPTDATSETPSIK